MSFSSQLRVFENLKFLGKILTFWPITVQRCRSETEKFILEDLLSWVLSQFKKYPPSGNLKFNNLDIFQSSKFHISIEKNLPISLNLKLSTNTLDCYGLILSITKIFTGFCIFSRKRRPQFKMKNRLTQSHPCYEIFRLTFVNFEFDRF